MSTLQDSSPVVHSQATYRYYETTITNENTVLEFAPPKKDRNSKEKLLYEKTALTAEICNAIIAVISRPDLGHGHNTKPGMVRVETEIKSLGSVVVYLNTNISFKFKGKNYYGGSIKSVSYGRETLAGKLRWWVDQDLKTSIHQNAYQNAHYAAMYEQQRLQQEAAFIRTMQLQEQAYWAQQALMVIEHQKQAQLALSLIHI